MISRAASRSTWPAYQGYFAQTGIHTIQAAAHGATAGFWWLLCPATSAKRLYVMKVAFVSQHNTALVTVSGPRIRLERMAFTGAIAGTATTPASALASAPAAVGTLRDTVPAGASADAAFHAFMPSVALTAVGAAPMSAGEFEPDEPLEVKVGQGVVCRQADSGTASDTRRFAMSVYWLEI